MDSSSIDITLGKSLYSITDTGFLVIYSSKYNYAEDLEIMKLILKYGRIILDDDFNAPIPFIVEGVSILICGKKFNQPLDNLPCSLRLLQIGAVRDKFYSDFTKSLKNLPHGLEDLRVFANEKTGVITKDLGIYLPSSVKKLCIHTAESPDINMLPDSIEELYIELYTRMLEKELEDIVKIPKNLKSFYGDSADWKFRNGLKAKFPNIEVKTVGMSDYWLLYAKY